MKLTFLGTSHGVPTAERYCSSAMLEVGDKIYLIDGGAPVLDLLLRKNISLERVKVGFCTHIHSDHFFGFLGLLDLMNWYYKTCTMRLYLPEQVGIDALRVMERAGTGEFDPARFHFTVIQPGLFYEDENITVTAIPTLHNRCSYAFLVCCEGKKLLFTGDLSAEMKDFPQIAEQTELDAVICECAHQSVETMAEHMNKCRTPRFILNHINHLEIKLPQIQKLQGENPQIIIAEDGQFFEI